MQSRPHFFTQIHHFWFVDFNLSPFDEDLTILKNSLFSCRSATLQSPFGASLSVCPSAAISQPPYGLETRKLVWRIHVTAVRPKKAFCEIFLFRPPYAPKTSKNPEILVPKMEFSVFSQFRVHFFMDHHHFWFVSCYGVSEEEDKRILRNSPF